MSKSSGEGQVGVVGRAGKQVGVGCGSAGVCRCGVVVVGWNIATPLPLSFLHLPSFQPALKTPCPSPENCQVGLFPPYKTPFCSSTPKCAQQCKVSM